MASGGAVVQDLLLDALEDLGQEEFEKLKFKLRTTAVPGGKNIPLGRLEKAKREELVELIVEFYEDKAVALIVTIFEDIGLKYNASKLSGGMDIGLYVNSVLLEIILLTVLPHLFHSSPHYCSVYPGVFN